MMHNSGRMGMRSPSEQSGGPEAGHPHLHDVNLGAVHARNGVRIAVVVTRAGGVRLVGAVVAGHADAVERSIARAPHGGDVQSKTECPAAQVELFKDVVGEARRALGCKKHPRTMLETDLVATCGHRPIPRSGLHGKELPLHAIHFDEDRTDRNVGVTGRVVVGVVTDGIVVIGLVVFGWVIVGGGVVVSGGNLTRNTIRTVDCSVIWTGTLDVACRNVLP